MYIISEEYASFMRLETLNKWIQYQLFLASPPLFSWGLLSY